ncbi:MAG: tetratricopeptide repeat protein [Myxococcales bacterium]|nr:tetratricopeptide repeat protein [Myxococcales bacterium]
MLTDPVLIIDPAALDQLAALLHDRAGLKITPDGYHGLKLALAARMPALGIAEAAEYVRRLNGLAGEHELRSLLPLVTVGKTEFFRDAKQFRALEKSVLTEILKRARREGQKALLWSAGCATGEEPYSLAMVALELGARPEDLEVWGTDLNLAAVESARAGRFSAKRLSNVSESRQRRFFRPVEDCFEIANEARQLVHFDGLNLASPIFPGVRPSSTDLILCRNVIIYFGLPTIRALMDRFLDALRPGGVLFLGYSESLFKVYDKFEMFEVEGVFAYRRPGRSSVAGDRAVGSKADTGIFRWTPRPEPARPRPAPPLHPFKVLAEHAPLPPPPKPEVAPKVSPADRLKAVVEKMNVGDFDGAVEGALGLSRDEPDDLGALLTLGNLHSLMGKNDEARKVFASVLGKEPLCVEARVFGGVAALQAGQLEDARAELGKALFLEPSLALGHYLLAQVQERLGDVEAARRSYRNAVAQLRFPQRALAGHYPDMPDSTEAIRRVAKYALAAVEER